MQNSLSTSSVIASTRNSQFHGYVIVTPVRNEEKFINTTIESVSAQTVLPRQWVIVDDGSTDQTWAMLQAQAQRHSWIRPVKRADRGFRHSGAGVVEAFYDGFDRLECSDWQFLVKLDGDVSFEPNYFAECFARFDRAPKLGIGGGLICALANGDLVPESKYDPAFHVRGATKIYRRECWDAIGGILRAPGWDGMDEIKANMLSWETATFPELKIRHYRPAGLATGRWKDWVKGGKGNYIAGYHPLFMIAKSLRRFTLHPIGLATLGLLTGYFGCWIKREPKIADEKTVSYIREQQLNRLLGKKSIWT